MIEKRKGDMTLEEVRELVERQAHAWVVENIELALPDFAPDAIFQTPGGRFEGRDQIREIANKFFQSATNLKVTITRLIFDGQAGAVEWTWEETVRATSLRHMAEDAIVFEIVDGQIVYWREYFDTAQMSKPVE
jgi:uncharacterized protein (TIGR02246 family)